MLEKYHDMLTIEEVMEILGLGKNSTYDLLRNGDIKGFMLKGSWKIPKQSVIDFINEMSSKPATMILYRKC